MLLRLFNRSFILLALLARFIIIEERSQENRRRYSTTNTIKDRSDKRKLDEPMQKELASTQLEELRRVGFLP